MNLIDRFNNWPPAKNFVDWLNRKGQAFADSMSARSTKIFTPIGNAGMRFYLGLKPHTDAETWCFGCLFFCIVGFTFYINTLP